MDIFREIADLRDSGKPHVLTTIVKTAGSSPREAGAKMLVFPDGSISGTIGGGNFEKMVIEDSMELLISGSSNLLKKYKFTQEGTDSTGMYCGGEAQVFMEVHGKPERLLIFGGGHVGKALSEIAEGLDFSITVIDDREEILKQYPSSTGTLLTDTEYRERLPVLDDRCYVVIVTKGHKSDREILDWALKADCAYVGMIGSKNKVGKIKADLHAAGLDQKKLDGVHAPVGLAIGAEGPREIAISIAAELIAVRRKTKSPSE